MLYRISLTVENVLSRIKEYDLYAYYWISNFTAGKPYYSPFRKESHPSFNIYYAYNGALLWKDFATGECGNVIQFIAKMFGITYNAALLKINRDLSLNLDEEVILRFLNLESLSKVPCSKYTETPLIHGTKKSLEIFDVPWNTENYSFWRKYGIPQTLLKFYNIYPITGFSFNGRAVTKLRYAYAFSFLFEGEIYYKIYQPFNTKYKWISNVHSAILQGLEQLAVENRKHDILIISKSLKDILCLRLLKVAAVAPQSESNQFTPELVSKLSLYGKKIIVFFDNDATGITYANLIKSRYGFDSIQLEQSKDISDYISKYGLEPAKKLLWEKINLL